MSNWDEIRKEWETSNITLADLAEKHGVKLGTLKSRKSREKWSRDATKKDATKNKKVATPKKKVATTKKVNTQTINEPVIENNELTDKQRLFCIYYVKYFNATKAYQKAYESSYEVANKNAHALMVKNGVQQEIQRLKQQRMNEAYFDKYDVLQKYKDIAFADITDYVKFGRKEEIVRNDDGEPEIDMNGNIVTKAVNYIHLNDSTEIDGTILTEVKEGRDGITVKLADKMKALEFLAKYTDLLSENDRKRLQDEKLKAETARVKAETDNIIKAKENYSPPVINIIDEWSDDDE